uniref:Uncharacterized protein n=1 Tax=Amphora coffeiformis TaxID=265554 RepID=A0A7S3LEA8_9STRA
MSTNLFRQRRGIIDRSSSCAAVRRWIAVKKLLWWGLLLATVFIAAIPATYESQPCIMVTRECETSPSNKPATIMSINETITSLLNETSAPSICRGKHIYVHHLPDAFGFGLCELVFGENFREKCGYPQSPLVHLARPLPVTDEAVRDFPQTLDAIH